MPRPANPSLRDDILTAALQLLDEHGIASFSMRELGRRLGYSATALYGYFASRDDLLIVLRLQIGDRLVRQVEQASQDTAPERQPHAMAHAYFQFAVENPAAYRFFFQFLPLELNMSPKQYRQLQRGWQLARAVLREWLAAHGVRGINVEQETQVGWALVHGITSLAIAQRLPVHDYAEVKALLDQALSHWQQGLLNRQRSLWIRGDTGGPRKHLRTGRHRATESRAAHG